jgi:RNA polymerase sigma-54 factor
MALEQKLSLKLAQKLVMTPSLQQAIKLLQMTRMELQQTLTKELVENPVLEEGDEPDEDELPETQASDQETEAATEQGSEELDHEESMNDVDLEAYFSDYWEGSFEGGSMRETFEAPPLENTLSREPDLYDHLLWQLHMMDVTERQRELAELVIGNLNPDGFLVATTEELRQLMSNGHHDQMCTLDEVDEALAVVRGLDPPGIACWELKESLLLQLDAEEEPEDSLARRIVADYWEPFLKRQFAQIAKELGCQLEELEPVIERIKALETRPGRKFSSERTQYVEPDVVILKVGDDYVIQLNDDGMPRLRISKAYRRMLQQMRQERGQAEAKQFIKEKMRSAIWLIKSLDQRQRTIYKVADSIIRQQRGFLDHGIDHLRPMVLRDVADDIGMHESTVSRVVSNKYIHTPRGLYPMKFFFHSGIDRDFGGDISSLTVKRKIEQLIKAEDPKRPLSDNALTKALNREGINIARRTVAKYRDELQIPSSTDRKQLF